MKEDLDTLWAAYSFASDEFGAVYARTEQEARERGEKFFDDSVRLNQETVQLHPLELKDLNEVGWFYCA